LDELVDMPVMKNGDLDEDLELASDFPYTQDIKQHQEEERRYSRTAGGIPTAMTRQVGQSSSSSIGDKVNLKFKDDLEL
jgi:hypothetical protein